MSNVRITMRAHGKAEVYIDGIRAKGVSAFCLDAGVGGKNTLTLQYSAQRTDDPRSVEVDSVEVEGVAVVSQPSQDEE